METLIKIAQVCIPFTKHDYFDYQIPANINLSAGMRVSIPFKQGTKIGVVIDIITAKAQRKLKFIDQALDISSILTFEILQLCKWISLYYQFPLSEVIPLALPKYYRQGMTTQLPTESYYARVDNTNIPIPTRAHTLHALINWMQPATQYSLAQILSAGFKPTALKKLIAMQLVTKIELPLIPSKEFLPIEQALELQTEQSSVVSTINTSLNAYRCFLLYGITGSGKTEVYLQIMAPLLQANKQVLVLVPEIGLTPQLLMRFKQRLHVNMVVIHSNLTDKERHIAFQWAQQAKVQLVIGTRSAIFTPLPKLALIIIDEEHDSSFKQMDGVHYSARDSAIVRAQQANIPIILGSATPCLESLHNCHNGKYHLLNLTQRALTKTPVHYQLIDMRQQILQEGFAEQTLATIDTHLKANNQVLIFINRRGFSPVFMCHNCGWIADCHACDAHLTLHQIHNKLMCHHCGLTIPIYVRCKSCANTKLIPIGLGTQRVHDFLAKKFTNTAIMRLDRDTLQHKHAWDYALTQIQNGATQLIIGTQLLAKGHHFPRLTLVVILDADNGLYNNDFRALEHLGQLITQVAGRAGRAAYPGQVLLQTHAPDHPMLKCLLQQGYTQFAQELLAMRKLATLPPYTFIALLRTTAKHMETLLNFFSAIKNHPKLQQVKIYGPAPAPLARKAHQHRMQLLLQASSRSKLNQILIQLRTSIHEQKLDKKIKWSIDVDPIDLN